VTWLNTSVHSGFARSASEAMFPRLFPDAGWWCPSLNPAMGGTRLWDLSRGNWGTLTSMANDDWVISGGKGALDFDGLNDYVTGSGNDQLIRAWSFWVKPNAIINSASALQAVLQTRLGTSLSWYIAFGSATGLLTNEYITVVDTSAGVNYRAGVSDGGSLPSTDWSHLAIVESGSSHAIYVNGISKAVTLNNTSPGTPIFNALRLGCVDGDGLGPRGFYAGQLDDIRIYTRALTATEARQLWQIGRGNMPLRRRRRYTEQAGGNRRRRVLLGAEC
jgi:hypothetical protein